MTKASGPPAPPRSGSRADGGLFDLDGAAARRWRPGRRATWRFLALALLALLLVGAALGRLPDRVERRADGNLARKQALLVLYPDSDILFVGTSQTLFAVDPALVDAALAEAGCAGRSLNLGMASARLEDIARLIDTIGPAPRRRLVVMEGGSFGGWVPQDSTARAEDRLPAGLTYLPVVRADVRTREQSFEVVLRFAYDALQYEIGKHRLYDLLLAEPWALDLEADSLAAQRGYLTAEEVSDVWGFKRRERFIERIGSDYTPERLAELKAPLRRRGPDVAASARALLDRLEALGQAPVLLLLPAQASISAMSTRALMAERPDLPAIDLALDRDVLPFPDADLFFDANHVSRLGAERLSREIGLRLCDLLRPPGGGGDPKP